MRKLFLIILLMLSAKLGFSQYFQFPDANAVWSIKETSFYERFYVDGDTIINSLTYKKYYISFDTIIANNSSMYAFLREDTISKKVYAISADSLQEHLIYDFSLNVGDTTTVYSHWWYTNQYFNVKVQAIDSLLIQGQFRKRLKLNNLDGSFSGPYDEYWIEGIGSTYGLFNAGLSGITFNLPSLFDFPLLNCFEQDDSLLFSQSNTPECFYMYTGVGQFEVLDNVSIKLFPNPAKDVIYLTNHSKDINISIFNNFGQQQLGNINIENHSINLSQLSKGFYFYTITDRHHTIMTSGKFIKD